MLQLSKLQIQPVYGNWFVATCGGSYSTVRLGLVHTSGMTVCEARRCRCQNQSRYLVFQVLNLRTSYIAIQS